MELYQAARHDGANPFPHTPHPAPCTLHPAPCTLHPKGCACLRGSATRLRATTVRHIVPWTNLAHPPLRRLRARRHDRMVRPPGARRGLPLGKCRDVACQLTQWRQLDGAARTVSRELRPPA